MSPPEHAKWLIVSLSESDSASESDPASESIPTLETDPASETDLASKSNSDSYCYITTLLFLSPANSSSSATRFEAIALLNS